MMYRIVVERTTYERGELLIEADSEEAATEIADEIVSDGDRGGYHEEEIEWNCYNNEVAVVQSEPVDTEIAVLPIIEAGAK